MSQPKDIIINAIRVLRSRRVRPSFAKIAWYIRREFLQSEEMTQRLLSELVSSGDITQVFYKGGNSFRVATNRLNKNTNKIMTTKSNKISIQTSSDVIRPLLNAISACGSCATKDRIAVKLVEADHGNIVDRLDVLLQKESRVGIIGRKTVFIGGRTLPAYFLTRSAPTSILNKSFSPETSPSANKKESKMASPQKIPAPFEHLQQQIKKLQKEKEAKDSDGGSSPEEMPKERNGSNEKSNTEEVDQEVEYQKLLDENHLKKKSGSKTSRRGRPRKAPIIYEDVSAFVPARRGRPPKVGNPIARTKHITKRGRRPLDSANETSARKRCLPSDTSVALCSGTCNTCGQPGTQQDLLLACNRCTTRAHPSCLGYSAKLADKSRLIPWTCMDCKLCEICYMDHTIGTLIFCDECDRAFHLTCHQPALDEQPQGTWICFLCRPNDGPNVYEYLQHNLPTPRDSPILDEESRESCGNWEQRSFDPSVPNATSWDTEMVVKHFNDRGFQDYANAFKEHEIDGTALMMLTRGDVLTGLGFLLGPALHIYKEIRILQTRNRTPSLP